MRLSLTFFSAFGIPLLLLVALSSRDMTVYAILLCCVWLISLVSLGVLLFFEDKQKMGGSWGEKWWGNWEEWRERKLCLGNYVLEKNEEICFRITQGHYYYKHQLLYCDSLLLSHVYWTSLFLKNVLMKYNSLFLLYL